MDFSLLSFKPWRALKMFLKFHKTFNDWRPARTNMLLSRAKHEIKYVKKKTNGLSILIRGVNHSQTRHHNYDNKILPTEGLNPFLSDRRFFFRIEIFSTYRLYEQRMLRRVYVSVQSRQNIHYSYNWSWNTYVKTQACDKYRNLLNYCRANQEWLWRNILFTIVK